MGLEDVPYLSADPADRIERGARILEYDADLSASQLVPSVLENVRSVERQAIGAQIRRRIEDSGDRVRGERFSRAALAHQRDELPGGDIEIDPVDSGWTRRVRAEADRQRADREQRRLGSGRVRAS